MALPYVVKVTCTAINKFPQAAVQATSMYARIHFKKAAAEASADRIETPEGFHTDEIILYITQAQKDDFTVGNTYELSIATPA